MYSTNSLKKASINKKPNITPLKTGKEPKVTKPDDKGTRRRNELLLDNSDRMLQLLSYLQDDASLSDFDSDYDSDEDVE